MQVSNNKVCHPEDLDQFDISVDIENLVLRAQSIDQRTLVDNETASMCLCPM